MVQTAYWPWPPVCFTCRPTPLPLRLDRLAVRDLGGMRRDLHAELPLQPFHLHLEVRLAHAVHHGLVRLVGARDPKRRVLLAQAREPGGELVLVALRLRLDRVREQRLGELDRRQLHRVVLRGERVARVRVLELRHGADVARGDLGDVLMLLAPQREQLADALVGVLGGVEHRRVGAEPAGEHAEHRDVPDERVRDGLEDERRQRVGGIAGALLLLAVLGGHRHRHRDRSGRGTPRR